MKLRLEFCGRYHYRPNLERSLLNILSNTLFSIGMYNQKKWINRMEREREVGELPIKIMAGDHFNTLPACIQIVQYLFVL